MERSATAKWSGGLKTGQGTLTTQSEVLKAAPYNYGQRFESKPGTNPEELIGAAHAGCYTMALSGEIEKRGFKADALEVKAAVTLQMLEKGPTVTGVHLELTALVPGASAQQIQEAAETAKKNCPISRLLNADITLSTKIASKVDVAQTTTAP